MHNSRDVTICVLSELMRPPVFVKLNAIEGLGGGAFTFSIFSNNFLILLFIKAIDIIAFMLYNAYKESVILRE